MIDWRSQAACAGLNTSIFYADEEERGERAYLRTLGAKAVCAGCPVRKPCLDYALGTAQKYGIWGGTTYQERRLMRRGRRRRAG